MKTYLEDHIEDLLLEELQTGIRSSGRTHTCVVCGTSFEAGRIYPVNDGLAQAELAAALHVDTMHGGVFQAILSLPGSITGLSELQTAILDHMNRGLSDAEIARALGGKAESTIRNHRFQMKRRRVEAKILLALTSRLWPVKDAPEAFVSYPAIIAASDERIVTTRKEAESILGKYLQQNSPPILSRIPRKAKERLVILKHISEQFENGHAYTEGEVNNILQAIHPDYVTIRRYLIDYRFLSREPGGQNYRVN